DVADMGHSVKRKRMVLAQREEGNGPFDDLADPAIGTASALGREGLEQLVITLVPRRRVEQSKQEPPRCVACPWAIEIHAEGLEDLGDVTLEPSPVLLVDLPRINVLPEGDLLWIAHGLHETHSVPRPRCVPYF